ncbi:hypothetical protein EVAR_27974_1 [Eumeta japonica]|uniref:Uncharacterized protein n=1 Tax=Eumeta variegata TaxID=151549 RepID=A0A4C1WB20_EUMVA|nr:hypothetical protein EVAR_27974_1 [Eumeta japonica]
MVPITSFGERPRTAHLVNYHRLKSITYALIYELAVRICFISPASGYEKIRYSIPVETLVANGIKCLWERSQLPQLSGMWRLGCRRAFARTARAAERCRDGYLLTQYNSMKTDHVHFEPAAGIFECVGDCRLNRTPLPLVRMRPWAQKKVLIITATSEQSSIRPGHGWKLISEAQAQNKNGRFYCGALATAEAVRYFNLIYEAIKDKVLAPAHPAPPLPTRRLPRNNLMEFLPRSVHKYSFPG